MIYGRKFKQENKVKVVVGTVIYRNAWNWHQDFLNSLIEQTDNEFDLLVVNDGLGEVDLKCFAEKCHKLQIDIIKGNEDASISENRIRLLAEAKNRKYDLLIWADFDDWFSKDRIEYMKNLYHADICIYYHNLRIDHGFKALFSSLPPYIDKIDELLEKNFLGLSNTAVNLNLIEPDLITSLENVQTNIFDWYFFSRLLLEEKKGIQVPVAYTCYRQQENQLAGIVHDDFKSLKKEIEIKLHHYLLLKQYSSIYSILYDSYASLSGMKESDMRKYLANETNNMWWSNFKLRRE